MLPSFDAYYGPFERGRASTGQAVAAIPKEIRRAVREVRRDLADSGGPVEAEYRIASGRPKSALMACHRSWLTSIPSSTPVPTPAMPWPLET